MTKKILIAHPVPVGVLKKLQGSYEINCIANLKNKYQQVADVLPAYDALLAHSHKVDQPLMDLAPNLQIVANNGVGYDNIDIVYAKEKGIAVTNTPNTTSGPTANFALGLIIGLMRKIVITDHWIRNRQLPSWGDPKIMGVSAGGMTLGIIGLGRIGKELAKRANVCGMKVQYHNRSQLNASIEKECNATYATLEAILQTSDVISIHTPLTPSTKHLINKERLSQMKPTAFLVNTSRGGVIDQQALVTALQDRVIAGAALDVFEHEPRVPEELLQMEQVVLTPHNGTGTYEARQAMLEEALGYIKKFLSGEEVPARIV